jgi:hypothetical protein
MQLLTITKQLQDVCNLDMPTGLIVKIAPETDKNNNIKFRMQIFKDLPSYMSGAMPLKGLKKNGTVMNYAPSRQMSDIELCELLPIVTPWVKDGLKQVYGIDIGEGDELAITIKSGWKNDARFFVSLYRNVACECEGVDYHFMQSEDYAIDWLFETAELDLLMPIILPWLQKLVEDQLGEGSTEIINV